MTMTPKKEKISETRLTVAHHDYNKALNLHAFFKTHDRAKSQDMVQETFLKTWSYLIRGGKIEVMKAFLYHVLNNLIIDEYRKHKPISLDMLFEKGIELGTDDSKRMPDILDGKTMFLLIERLPEMYRKVMQMRYVKELSLEEMSLITGKLKNTIAVQAHRGLEMLKLMYNTTPVSDLYPDNNLKINNRN